MKVSFAILLNHNPRLKESIEFLLVKSIHKCLISIANLFKKIVADVSTKGVAFEIKVNVHIFAESTRIIISNSFRIAESFQNAV